MRNQIVKLSWVERMLLCRCYSLLWIVSEHRRLTSEFGLPTTDTEMSGCLPAKSICWCRSIETNRYRVSRWSSWAPLPWTVFSAPELNLPRRPSGTDWANHPHVQVYTGGSGRSPVDDAATLAGISRQTPLQVSGFLEALHFARSSQMLFTSFRELVTTPANALGLLSYPLPFDVPSVPVSIITRQVSTTPCPDGYSILPFRHRVISSEATSRKRSTRALGNSYLAHNVRLKRCWSRVASREGFLSRISIRISKLPKSKHAGHSRKCAQPSNDVSDTSAAPLAVATTVSAV